MRTLNSALFWFVVLLLSAPLRGMAQETSGDDSTVVYPANYFSEWSPITAQDMLDRIPGFSGGNGPGSGGPGPGGFSGNPSSGGRGFGGGSSGNEILVNGKRTAGKNNQTRGLLSRIAANQVREIQIIRGTSGALDVRGSSQVVNVVLFEELSSSTVSYEANVSYVQDDTTHPGGNVALSGQNGSLDYLFSLRSNPRYSNSLSNESSILGDFSPNDTVIEERTTDQTQNELSMNLSYDFTANSSIRLNALYAINDNPTDVSRVTTNLRTNPVGLLVEREDIPGDRDNWEIGGDYELSLDNGGRFKLLAIANQDNQDTTRQRWQLFGDGSERKNLFLNTNSVTEERILRSSYTFDVFSGQDVEFGIERAQTILDSRLALGIYSTTGTPSDAVGGLVPQKVPNANSKVEEIRYEPFLIHNWILNPRMSLESTLIYESSEITQTGDVSNQRDFSFIKPKVDFRFDVTPTLQLRGTVERIVNQLTFADFVAANDEQDEDSNVLAGNAQLRQQTQWRYTFNTEWRLPNDAGVVNGEFFYADHQDVIDRLDASTSETNLLSVNGNIGDGKEYGMNLTAGIRMGMIGLPNLLVTPGLNVQDSEVVDPFLGIKRRFQFYQRGRFTLTTRHDIPAWRFNWGAQYFDRIDGGMFRYDVDDIEFSVGEPRVNFFAEYVDSRGLTWRLDLGAITDGTQCRERWRYDGRISANVLEELESRCTHGGVETSLKVSGTF
jgi:hypothetical protein